MSDDDYFEPPRKTRFHEQVPTVPEQRGSRIGSWIRRLRGATFEREIEQATRVIRAGRDLNHAKAEYAESRGRITGDNLKKIQDGADLQVDAEFREIELNRAEKIKAQQQFELKAEIEDLELQARRERAMKELRTAQGENDDTSGGSPEERRRTLEREIDQLFRELEGIDAEYAQRSAAGTADEAFENVYNMKRNRIMDRLHRKQAEEEAL